MKPATPYAATEEQMTQLKSRTVSEVTLAIATNGIFLTHEQAEELGDETLAWMCGLLGASGQK